MSVDKWRVVKLSEVLTERAETPASADLDSGAVPVISKITFHDGNIHLRVGGETKTPMILIRPGDLVLSGINAVKGAIAIYSPNSSSPIAATIHYSSYIPNRERIETRFLWHMLRSKIFQESLLENLPGGIKTELKANRFLSVSLPIPQLDEQQRIVTRIDELAERVHESQSLRRNASEELQVLFFQFLRAAFDEYRHTSVPIGQVFRVTTGGTPSRSNPAYWGGTNNWVSSGEVAFQRIKDTQEKITDLGVQRSNAKLYPPNTVLIAMIGQGKTRGQCAVLDCQAATNQNVAAIHVYDTTHIPEYVYWWLYSQYYESRVGETGTAQPALNGQRVKDMMIPLPTIAEQLEIVAYLNGLQQKMDELRQMQTATQKELDALMPSILSKAFAGEL